MKYSPIEDETLAVPWDSLTLIDHVFDLAREEGAIHIKCQLPPID